MPYAAAHFCNRNGCHNYAMPGTSYCQEHQKSVQNDYRRDRTDVAEQTFYRSAAWRQAREWHLAAHPLCEVCLTEGRLTPATIVHHMKELRDFPLLALDQDNLESLCEADHNKKHPNKGGNHG